MQMASVKGERGTEGTHAALTFGQIEATLAAAHGIAPDKRVAFTSRLKHLQKLGIPFGGKPGKGRAGLYTASHLLQISTALELVQAGLTPSTAVTFLDHYWMEMLVSMYPSVCGKSGTTQRQPTEELEEHDNFQHTEQLWLFIPTALREIVNPDRAVPLVNLVVLPVEGLSNYLSMDLRRPKDELPWSRYILVRGWSVAQSTLEHATALDYVTEEQFSRDLAVDPIFDKYLSLCHERGIEVAHPLTEPPTCIGSYRWPR
jgi:hypothetical protein